MIDYFGQMVNRSARVEGTACGGQIVVSGDVWNEIKQNLKEVGSLVYKFMGEHKLKGLETTTALYEILPGSLQERNFPIYGVTQIHQENKKLDQELEKIKQENMELQNKLHGLQTELQTLENSAIQILSTMTQTQDDSERGNLFFVFR